MCMGGGVRSDQIKPLLSLVMAFTSPTVHRPEPHCGLNIKVPIKLIAEDTVPGVMPGA